MGIHYEDLTKPFVGVIVAEDCAEDVVGFDTEAEMNAFSSGLSAGAGLYGGDGCGFWTLADLEENGGEIERSDDRYDEIKTALTFDRGPVTDEEEE